MSVFETLKEAVKLSFDPQALEQKYKEERDKRVRPEGDSQYQQLSMRDRAGHFFHDPYAPYVERSEIHEDLDVVVIGGGWAGLITAANLKRNGIDNVKIIESGADFGGTWYWNRYPGCQCDIQSYTYLPLLEETGYVPKERYSHAPEIQEHAQRIGRHFGLYEHAVFQTFVTGVRWDEDASAWHVATNRNDKLRARFVVMAQGAVNQLRLPGVSGLDDFKGHTFHTCRWDYEYTGGGPDDFKMTKLADKRVAIIGTGATAVQCIPHLGESAGHLYVFQRTPSTVAHRNNKPTDPEWARSLKPGWQRDLMKQLERAMAGEKVESEIISEEDVLIYVANVQELMGAISSDELSDAEKAEIIQLADYQTLEGVRARVDELVANPATAEKLKPWYNYFCKRPTFHNGYLQTFNRENVTLVDVSEARGLDRITETGIVANGVEYEVDCIVFASGFEITSSYEKRYGMSIEGVDGRSLFDNWREGMRSMHGMMFEGFPNLVQVGGVFAFQIGLNYAVTVQEQAKHAAYVVAQFFDHDARSLQPSREAEEAWLALQLAPSEGGRGRPILVGGAPESCTPGYYNYEGKPIGERPNPRREGFDKGGLTYLELLSKWRAGNMLEGMKLER